MEWTQEHLEKLARLVEQGFEVVRFPLFASSVGIQKFGCAALLRPADNARLELSAPPGYLLEGNIAALVEREGENWFVWKSLAVPATKERLSQLRRFQQELERWIERQEQV